MRRQRDWIAAGALAMLVAVAACGSGSSLGAGGVGATGPSSAVTTSAVTGSGSVATSSGSGGAPPGCVKVDESAAIQVGAAGAADEYALALPAAAASRTAWAEPGNEALVLEVNGQKGLIGHLILHQGADAFTYTMQLGHLDAGEAVSVRVSSLSAAAAKHEACVGPATLTPVSSLPAAGEGLVNAPILRWPVKKRFDDLPVVLGWSKQKQHYELVYTNENGGTVAQCGGGADGIEAEIARWGRAADIEGIFTYGGATKKWERCTGVTGYDVITPRVEGAHPILYYGDGHNRLFESRGGYGATCGTGSDAQADGDLQGWNVNNPGNAEALDGAFTVTLRPLPVDLDALGFGQNSGRREALIDVYAPWLYRVTAAELEREGKIDQKKTFPVQQYLYADVYAADVDGSGDKVCALLGVSGGFVLRAVTTSGTLNGPQMTSDYFGGAINWKRIAIPLDKVYAKTDFSQIVFDAYDNDGIYWLALGDVFIPRPSGDNGAVIEYVHQGKTDVGVYVDDDSSSCVGGVNTQGPNGKSYPCTGSLATFDLP